MQTLPEICSVDGVKLAVARLSEEAVLGLDGEDVLVTDVVGLGVDLLGQGEVEVTDGALLDLTAGLSRLPEEADPAQTLVVWILDSTVEGKTVLSEGVELVTELVSGLGHGEQVPEELQVMSFPLEDLHVSGLCYLVEVFLVLQSLLLLVVRHAEDSHPRLQHLVTLSEDTKLCHERNVNCIFVESRRHLGGLCNIPAVHQPEPGADLE